MDILESKTSYKESLELFKNMEEGICILDKEGRVIFWNEFMEKKYDILSEEIMGKSIDNFFYKIQDKKEKNSSKGFDKLIGKSDKLEKCKEIGKKIADTNSSILIYGESGTGKEILAKAIHEYSGRKGEFIAVNCSAIPSELFESEFFGYESGSFTGANKKGKLGIFQRANEGTVFLDEIGDLPQNMQAKLLRVIQEKEVRKIGGEQTIKINVRIISATNKNLLQLVHNNEFREDLYYRINVVQIEMPPLRERKEDISILVNYFINEMCRLYHKKPIEISEDALLIIKDYDWKGNIRELKNTLENLVLLSKNNIVTKEDLPSFLLYKNNLKQIKNYENFDLNKCIEDLEKKMIEKVLVISHGNKSKAAKLLNIPRTTLYYKLDQYNIKL